MRLSDAFRETMFRFRLKGINVAEASGLSPNQISSFQNGGNLRSDSIDKLLVALNRLQPGSVEYMLSLVIAGNETFVAQSFQVSVR